LYNILYFAESVNQSRGDPGEDHIFVDCNYSGV
jgi:hypothetical protein